MTLLWLLACSAPAPPVDSADPADPADPADSADPGEGPEALDVSAEVLDTVATVVRVTWRTAEPSTGAVQFGESDTYGLATGPTAEGTEHSVLLLGNPADTDVHFRVITQQGEATAETDDLTIRTGPLPSGLPELDVVGTVTGWSGYLAMVYQGTTDVVTLLDTQGRIVWYHTLAEDLNAPRARLDVDGQSVLVIRGGTTDRDFGTMVRIPIEGGDEELLALEAVHHDFVQHADGTLGALFIEAREGWPSDADGIVELAPDGTQRVVFNAWDAFDPTAYGADEPIECWTHANALDYDEDTDTYYVSMRSLGTLLAVDGATGDMLWSLFGRTGDVYPAEGSEPSTDHHQFDVLDDSVLLFDNGSNERGYSAVLEYALDLGQSQATQIAELRHDPDLTVWALGDAERLDDGGTRIVWSTSGEIQDLDADGQVTWQVNSSLGYGVGYVSPFSTFYPG